MYNDKVMGAQSVKTVFITALSVVLLLGCSGASAGYKPQPMVNKTYQAPAQAFALNLSSQLFRGGVSVTESCDVAGSSTDFIDGESQFYRVDVINLINNPNLELPEFADDVTVRELVQDYYATVVNDKGNPLDQISLETTLGSAMYTVTQFENPNTPYMGYLVVRRGNFVYVLQHVQKQYRPKKMQERLLVLSQAMRVPGFFADLEPRVEGPIYIDMQNATPNEIANWRTVADCEPPQPVKK